MAAISGWNLALVKADLLRTIRECSQRGLLHSVKWAAELCYTLKNVHVDTNAVPTEDPDPAFQSEFDQYQMAKSYFDLREYDRAAHFTQECQSQRAHFLHLYAQYLSGEKKKVDHLPDSTAPSTLSANDSLNLLRAQLQTERASGELDGFSLYLYGVVLKKLDLRHVALDVLLLAVRERPLHWGAWMELASLVTDRNMLLSLDLPDVWIKQFFIAHVCLELQVNEEAMSIYQQMTIHGFATSTYIMAQTAIALHNIKDVDQSVLAFQKLQKADPCRLDNMDTFSNLLYVKEMRVELGYLAHRVFEIDKYRVETCCVIGNFYSLRSQHEKAVLYFQRALKLNPNYLSAWTLMGHEYMEMKNTSAAIQAYRQAIEVNRRDYRAWYGLGQTYEILKMSYYCLYYYRQAQQLRPNDSRMLVALGVAYEKLEKMEEAKKCYWKAHSVGDIEGMALMKLGKLHSAMGAEDQAMAVFSECIKNADAQIADREELCQAHKYLAEYYLKREMLDQSYNNAFKCTDFVETREAGNALLRQIAQLRSTRDDSIMQV